MSEIVPPPADLSRARRLPEAARNWALFEQYSIDPVIDETVQGLGDVCMRDVRFTGKNTEQQPNRVHRLYTVELNDYDHAVEVTDPVSGEADYTVLSFPGLTEHIEGGIRQKMQSHLSYALPNARIVSVASNGIGKTGGRYSWDERQLHGLASMGEQRVDLARALGGKKPVVAVGTSMGTVILHHMVQSNRSRSTETAVDLRAQILMSHALVDPQNVRRDMITNFLPGLGFDVLKEVVKTPPTEIVSLTRRAIRHGFHPDDAVALGHQILELLKGTPEAHIAATIAALPTAIITGKTDSLAQHEMFARFSEYLNPEHVEIIKGRGHALAMKPERLCKALMKVGLPLIEQQIGHHPRLTA